MKDAEIAELRQMVEQLQASVADLQRGFERPVVQAEVVENSSSSSHLDQSLESSWLMTAPQPLAPQSPTLVHEVVEEAKAVDVVLAVEGLLLNAQQAEVILPGKVFEGNQVTNVVDWSPAVDVSPGSPKEVETTPVEEATTALGSGLMEGTVVAPVSPTWHVAPSSPPDYGPVADVPSPCTPKRTPPRSPRSLSSRASGFVNSVLRRSPSQKRK